LDDVEWATVFDILKKKPEIKAAEKPKTATKKPQKNLTRTKKPAKLEPAKEPVEHAEPVEVDEPAAEGGKASQVHEVMKDAEEPFVCVKEYGSAVEIAEKIDREMASTKSALGGYLRQLDDVRTVAEKSKRLHDVVAKMSGKKQQKEKSDQIEVGGLEIVLDATPLHELEAIESVVRSHQQRLLALQKAKQALEPLDPLGDTEGLRFLVLEKQGIPEQIMLKLT
jgi:hypothetical protein